MDRAALLLDVLQLAGEKWNATVLLLLSDRPDFVEQAVKTAPVPVVLATSDQALADANRNRVRAVRDARSPPSGSVNLLSHARDVLLSSFLEGVVKPGERVVCIAAGKDALDLVLFFDADRDVELTRLRKEIEGRAKLAVVERVLHVASELAREGREGKPVGALFVIGDTEAVFDRSRQAVINPFQGHPEKDRNLLAEAVTETVKEFALLDGAFILRADGIIESAGRYIDLDKRVSLEAGLGGRHLAAASITKATKAIAIAVSSSGTIRVFKDGKVILTFGKG